MWWLSMTLTSTLTTTNKQRIVVTELDKQGTAFLYNYRGLRNECTQVYSVLVLVIQGVSIMHDVVQYVL